MKKLVCSKVDPWILHLVLVFTKEGTHTDSSSGLGELGSPRVLHSPSGLHSWKCTLFAMWYPGHFQRDSGSRQGNKTANKINKMKQVKETGCRRLPCNSKFTSACPCLAPQAYGTHSLLGEWDSSRRLGWYSVHEMRWVLFFSSIKWAVQSVPWRHLFSPQQVSRWAGKARLCSFGVPWAILW